MFANACGYEDCEDHETWIGTMRHVAIEGLCFVLLCKKVKRRRHFPDDYGIFGDDDPDAVITRGNSCIIDSMG